MYTKTNETKCLFAEGTHSDTSHNVVPHSVAVRNVKMNFILVLSNESSDLMSTVQLQAKNSIMYSSRVSEDQWKYSISKPMSVKTRYSNQSNKVNAVQLNCLDTLLMVVCCSISPHFEDYLFCFSFKVPI